MKLFSLLTATTCLAASAFGVTPVVSKTKGFGNPALVKHQSPLRQKNAADVSPLFRDPTVTRGGAVSIPGLDAYSKALDEKPITMKALTSLVGWFLGDLLAQVSAYVCDGFDADGYINRPRSEGISMPPFPNAIPTVLRSSLPAGRSTGSASPRSPSSDSSTTDPPDTTSTTGSTRRSPEPTQCPCSRRSASTRSCGVPSS